MSPFILSSLLLVTPPAGPVSWSFSAKPAHEGQVTVEIVAKVEEGWHIYATKLESDMGPIPTSFHFEQSAAYVPVGGIREPQPEEVFDPNFGMQVRYHSGSPVFTQQFKVAQAEEFAVKGQVEFMVCNDKTCLPPEVVEFTVQLESDQSK